MKSGQCTIAPTKALFMYQSAIGAGSRTRQIRDALEITELRPPVVANDHSSRLHPADDYEIFYLLAGGGELLVNLHRNQLDPQHLYFVYPGQLRALYLNEAATGFHLKVSEDFLQLSDAQFRLRTLLEQGKKCENAKIIGLDSNHHAIEEMLGKIHAECLADHPLQLEMIHVFFKTFLLYLLRRHPAAVSPDGGSNDARIVQAFVQLVNRQFIEKKMVGDYADELCVTRSYLNKVVKKVTGVTASNIIQQCIIREAKKQALNPELTMKQIAYQLGFEDSAHFSKFFKNNCGLNFTNFKREAWLLQ